MSNTVEHVLRELLVVWVENHRGLTLALEHLTRVADTMVQTNEMLASIIETLPAGEAPAPAPAPEPPPAPPVEPPPSPIDVSRYRTTDAGERTDYRWRRHPEMKIEGPWINWFFGGKKAADHEMHYRMRDFVLARRYIGPKVA